MRKVLARVGLVLFGLGLSAILVEAILQVGALYVRRQGDEIGSWASGGALRVLSLGDSNTYGLHLKNRKLAYPAVLESLWNRRFPEQPIEVINAGVPGTNSSKLLNEFPALLQTFQPDVVTIMIGVNDFWTEPDPIRPPDTEKPEEAFSWWSHSRLYRLFYMLIRALQQPKVEIEFADPEGYRPNRGAVRYGEEVFDLGWTHRSSEPVADWESMLSKNCKALVDQARANGVVLILMTYAWQFDTYLAASHWVRNTAHSTGAPLLDLQPVFQPLCEREGCDDLYFPSNHPTVKGHRLIANALLLRLMSLIGE